MTADAGIFDESAPAGRRWCNSPDHHEWLHMLLDRAKADLADAYAAMAAPPLVTDEAVAAAAGAHTAAINEHLGMKRTEKTEQAIARRMLEAALPHMAIGPPAVVVKLAEPEFTPEQARQFEAELREALAGSAAADSYAILPPRVQHLGTVADQPGYCRKCDVFIGYGALDVAKPPEDRAHDQEWLASHCWVCGRSRGEVASDR